MISSNLLREMKGSKLANIPCYTNNKTIQSYDFFNFAEH